MAVFCADTGFGEASFIRGSSSKVAVVRLDDPTANLRDFAGTSSEAHGILGDSKVMTLDRSRIRGQAKYWGVHCSVNALPSFIMATCYLEMAKDPLAVIAMLLAIGTFIIAYTLITSIDGLFTDSDSLLSRALRIGVKFRLVVSLISLPFMFPTPALLFVPDVWAGMIAAGGVNWVGSHLGGSGMLIGPSESGAPMLAVYATTILEGLILSLSLFMVSFFTLLILQMKNRKKALEVVLPPDTT